METHSSFTEHIVQGLIESVEKPITLNPTKRMVKLVIDES